MLTEHLNINVDENKWENRVKDETAINAFCFSK